MTPPPSNETIQMIKKIRNAMLVQYRPKVQLYLDTVEPRYRKFKAKRNEEPQSFPEVLGSVIAEYALEKKYYWASRTKKGLLFLTEQEHAESADALFMSIFDEKSMPEVTQEKVQEEIERFSSTPETFEQYLQSLDMLQDMGHWKFMQFATLLKNLIAFFLHPLRTRPNSKVTKGVESRLSRHLCLFAHSYMKNQDKDRYNADEIYRLSKLDYQKEFGTCNPEPLLVVLKDELLRHLRDVEGIPIEC
jgi:hypothetical protein